MSYLEPTEFVTKMVDAGESKVYMSTKDTLIRAFMAGAILGLAAIFAITVAVQKGSPPTGGNLFPFCFILLSFHKFYLPTVVFSLFPHPPFYKKDGVTVKQRYWHLGVGFIGKFSGATLLPLSL